MFTHKDIESRSIFVVNSLDNDRTLRVRNGELLVQEQKEVDDKPATLTKVPFQKVLAIFVIGNSTITTPLIEKCKKHGVGLVVFKPNLRPVFFWSDPAEANFLLRQRQFAMESSDITVAKVLVANKIENQMANLKRSRRKDDLTLQAIEHCQAAINTVPDAKDIDSLRGIEGSAAKAYFAAFFQSLDWHGREPRLKRDPINVALDIGYTVLFNFIEAYLRLFGFDVYVGVYHRLWFKRKSLVCDIVEPFRFLVDRVVLTGFNRKQFSAKQFECYKGEYRLKRGESMVYYLAFFEVLKARKADIFKYVQAYYRCFMGRKSVTEYPKFQ